MEPEKKNEVKKKKLRLLEHKWFVSEEQWKFGMAVTEFLLLRSMKTTSSTVT